MLIHVGFYRRKPGLSWEQFSRHWREVHGPLMRDNERFKKYCRRYVQHHLRPYEPSSGPKSMSFDLLPFDGFSEVWFDDLQSREEMWSDPAFKAAMLPDEELFLDLSATKVGMLDTQVVQIGSDMMQLVSAGAALARQKGQ